MCIRHLRDCEQLLPGMYYNGNTIRKYDGKLDVSWKRHGIPMRFRRSTEVEVPWKSNGSPMEVPWKHHGGSMGISKSRGSTTEVLWELAPKSYGSPIEVPMGIPGKHHGSLEVPWESHENLTGTPWKHHMQNPNSDGSLMEVPGKSHGNTTEAPWKLRAPTKL